ncbi:inactive protein kinase SELMODRAFT_444075-like isoform X2 [Humulus lupulus]|uniref:inactive protein kinase SELMODRAFT_444075-like isoform X2 n=1 Tax=Humulus lupulus TaxID=3486 RepID=UPI002B404402|nr:inactive protein kinase SELMODRAFT_444075-like isoform X2 [Humulus lupulus]
MVPNYHVRITLEENSTSSSAASPSIQSHRSKTTQFFSCLLNKFGIGHNNEGSSNDDIVLINGVDHDVLHRVNSVCADMMQQLCSALDLKLVHTEVKVVTDAQLGTVTSRAEELQATWVILDRRLKRESDHCLKQLNCNIVLIDHAIPKILKAVNLPKGKKLVKGNHQIETETKMLGLLPRKAPEYTSTTTTGSSLTTLSEIFDTDVSLSISSTDRGHFNKHSPSTRKLIPCKQYLDLNSQYFPEKVEAQETVSKPHFHSNFQPFEKASSLITGKSHPKSLANPLYEKNKSYDVLSKDKTDMDKVYDTNTQKSMVPPRRSADLPHLRKTQEGIYSSKQLITTRDSLTEYKREDCEPLVPSTSQTMNRISSIRKAMSLYTKHPPNPPPLCSICKHNTPIFGKAPRKFSFKEIERATDRFSSKNFLAEGGFGPVHRGVLHDGQVVAVKQHKMLSAQGASEFCSEVEVLSCAQHRNLVMLVGYCTETEWLLVYEFACNGSLDKHLYRSQEKELMSWKNRMKVAIGAARGLRYLHEDCRVGCIVHRDLRPNNILLTHDFEPMVGDFGLARWQVDGQSAEETRVIGALGYVAPEYTQSGLITEKADVYAFGVVLLELLSGFNVTEFSRKTGQQFVSEWGSPLLESMKIDEVIDSRLERNYEKNEVECMMYAASLCISPHPEQRPRMSKVLKILEGDVLIDMACNYGGSPSLCSPQSINSSQATDQRTMQSTLPSSNTLKPVPPSKRSEILSTACCLNQLDSNVNQEYEAYLQNSLAKFVQNLNGNYKN